jgi:uracil-DNA glycosylase family 4
MLPKPTSCSGCPLFGRGVGYVPADGSGRNGVLIVLEAAGADEEQAGLPVVGKAGYYLFTQLAKVGLERDDFRIHNVLSCRPPDNKLAGEAYEAAAISHCSPHLDATIREHIAACRDKGLHPTILTLGAVAFKRVMSIASGQRDPILAEDYYGYVHRSPLYDCWVVAAPHPAFLLRGQHQYVPVLQFAAQRAVEVAREGFTYADPPLLLDPPPTAFAAWVRGYFDTLDAAPSSTYLSTDIETPMKAKKDEEKLAREDDEDYIILRCSFAYNTPSGELIACSVPWTAEYTWLIEQMLADRRTTLIFWNENYDLPRIRNQMQVAAANVDAMLAWHVLNSALDKRLGFVTPYYWKNARMWKHLSQAEPARYNALDALAALINFLGIRRDLQASGQWEVFERHVVQLNVVLTAMSTAGLQRDDDMRAAAEAQLTALLTEAEARIVAAVPAEARRLQVYKKAPKDTSGLKEIQQHVTTKRCVRCHAVEPLAAHFKSIGKKRLKAGEVENPCLAAGVEPATVLKQLWARELEWKPSTVALKEYAAALKHQVVKNREGNATFDEDALEKLLIRYPADPLYPLLLDHRRYQKLRGTYIGVTGEDGIVRGGLRVGRDGLIHAEFTHNPSTLRMACQNPNMQNLPRTSKRDEDLENIVRNLVVARDGCLLLEADFAAIEAVLSAYFARWKDGIRLAKLGVHSYLASHVLGRPADLGWSDADLKRYFAEIKGSKDPKVNQVYNGCKRAIHLSNYGGTPRKMVQAEPDTFPTVAYAERLQGMYFEVAKPIRTWQLQTQMEAHQKGFLRNPFGYIHRFTHVFRHVKEGGQWVRKPGDQANDVLAFLPQSTAAGIIKEAMLRLYYDTPAGPDMRLQVHDSLVLEVREAQLEERRALLVDTMEAPVLQLPLPASFEMGPHLSIDVDTKSGKRWGQCR